MLRVVVVVAVLVVFVYGLVDVIRTDPRQTKGISKPAWIVVQIVLPVIGAILWFLIGRPRGTSPARADLQPPHRARRRPGIPAQPRTPPPQPGRSRPAQEAQGRAGRQGPQARRRQGHPGTQASRVRRGLRQRRHAGHRRGQVAPSGPSSPGTGSLVIAIGRGHSGQAALSLAAASHGPLSSTPAHLWITSESLLTGAECSYAPAQRASPAASQPALHRGRGPRRRAEPTSNPGPGSRQPLPRRARPGNHPEWPAGTVARPDCCDRRCREPPVCGGAVGLPPAGLHWRTWLSCI